MSEKLPNRIPVFPLRNAIFFPETNLPLNIFEQRYLEMIDFALKSNRLIGMIQNDKNNKLYSIGCVGKLNSFSETDDGRYVINLIGKNYFRISKKLPKTYKFITAEIEIILDKKELALNKLNKFNKDVLLEKYKKFNNSRGIKVDLDILNQINNDELIKFVAMSCPFSTEDKQMLLETFNIYDLGNKLISLFDFYDKSNVNNSLN